MNGRRLTDWDWWVIAAICMSLVGWAITITMLLEGATRSWLGYAAASTCQLYAFVLLVVAHLGPAWLVD